jgi:exopolyphosphatase / guanosine-5'-triphosphate,3'-diphosphate pyrophosphatase
MKVAVFDLGSNTTKLLVSEVDDRGNPQVVAEESRACRLTAGGGEEFCFPEKSIERLLAVLGELMEIARGHEVDRMKAVATEAFRRSENTQDLIALTQASLGLPISVLSGSEEAGAIATGLLSDPLIARLDDFHAIDLGGGSMEVIAVNDRVVSALESLPLGAAVLSGRFCADANCEWPDSVCLEAKDYVISLLASSNSHALSGPCSSLVGSGGSLVFLRKILAVEGGVEAEEKGILKLSEVDNLFERISRMSLEERRVNYPALPQARADIFPAGLLVLSEVMSYFNRTQIIHSYRSLRYGVAMELAMKD